MHAVKCAVLEGLTASRTGMDSEGTFGSVFMKLQKIMSRSVVSHSSL